MSITFSTHQEWADALVSWAARHANGQPNTAAVRSYMHAHNEVVIAAAVREAAARVAANVYVMALDYTPTPVEVEAELVSAKAALRKAENDARKALKGRLINR